MRQGLLVGVVCSITAMAGVVVAPSSAVAASKAKCAAPPLTMRVEAGGTNPVGSTSMRVTDGVARRVPIMPNAKVDFNDMKARAALEKRAAKTPLALYTIYLSDFKIPRSALQGFGDVPPSATGTIATLTLVPPTKKGFKAGDVVTAREIDYDTITTFGPVGLTVRSARNASAPLAYTDVVGKAKILELTSKRMCVDIDFELRNGSALVTALQGTVAVPVVRAASSFYFT